MSGETAQVVEGLASKVSPGDLAELMGVFNEVTSKLERTHEQLRGEVSRLNEELEHANEALQRSKRLSALGEMAAGISHEIRNPLGSIKLHTRMLLEDLEGMDEQREIVRKIDSAVRGLDQIVGDVLSFSREIRVRASEHETHALLEGVGDLCAADLRGVEVDISIAPGAGSVLVDAGLTHQALVNLVRNAAQACKGCDERRVTLGARPAVEEDALGARGGTVLSVSDTGPGIAPDVLERMFNPFFTTRAAGTGLGLAIVHRIVDAHGGCVGVMNNEDRDPGARGATVSLCFPGVAAAQHEAPVVVRAGAMPAREKAEVV